MAVNEDFKEKVLLKQERDAVNRALNVVAKTQNFKRFNYAGDEQLTLQIYEMYPEATHLVIVNNNNRDGEGFPIIKNKQLRERLGNVTWSQGKRIIHSLKYNDFKVVLCVVEGGKVGVKTVTRDLNFNTGYDY